MFGRQLQISPETLPMIEELGRHMPGGFFIYRAGEALSSPAVEMVWFQTEPQNEPEETFGVE